MTQASAQSAPADATKSLAKRYSPQEIVTKSKDDLAVFCKENPDEAARHLWALARINTGEVPGTLFVKRGEDMMLQRVAATVMLKESRKELVSFSTKKREKVDGRWQDKEEKRYDLTAVGYLSLNQTIGLRIETPPNVIVNGQRQLNPYVEMDPASGNPRVVYCRKIVWGSARDTGNLVATDLMLRFDLNLYLLETLLAKLKYMDDDKQGEFGVWGSSDPEEKPAKGWKFYPISGDAGVWFNMRHARFAQAMQDHVTRMKFAERIAQTVATRNALKTHPGMPPGSPDHIGDGVARMTVFGWTSRFRKEDLEKLRQAIENDTLDQHEYAGQKVQVERVEVEKIDDADIADAEEELAAEKAAERTETETGPDPEPQHEESERKPSEARADRAQLIKAAMDSYQAFRDSRGPAKAKELLHKLGITGEIADATDDQLIQLSEETTF